jgi:hypothetical protein
MMAAEGGLRHVLVGGHQKVVLLGCQLLVGAGECLLSGLAVGGGLVHPARQLTDEFVLVYISGGGARDEHIVKPVKVLYLVYETLVLHLLLERLFGLYGQEVPALIRPRRAIPDPNVVVQADGISHVQVRARLRRL